jgi:NTP pyrophosphatase (non-canonical NTP hydrolase)
MKTSNYLDPERLAKLQQRIWETATAHGWHEQPIPTAQYCGLIMTEMAEAIEADRNGRRADIESFNERMSSLDGSDECFKEIYKRYIKGSIEEEFADVVIRVLDMAQEVHGDRMRWLGYYPWGQVYHEDKSFIENAWYFIREILNWGTMNISDSVSFMFDWAQDLGIDLWQHIEWKMKYNELRPYKHGGKKY